MLCKIYKYRISAALDRGEEPNEVTMRHIAKCVDCRVYYDKLRRLDSLLADGTDAGLENYDFIALNGKISDRLDKTIAGHHVPAEVSSFRPSKFALAATLLIAATLGISIFSAMTPESTGGRLNSLITAISNIFSDPDQLAASRSGIPAPLAITTNMDKAISPDLTGSQNITGSPQMALFLQLSALPYDKMANMPYQELKRSKELYDKTSEITAKSTIIITTLAQNSIYFIRPF